MPPSYKIEWLPEAVTDLDRLRSFIQLHDPKAAARAAKKIIDGIHKLKAFPLVGRPVLDMPIPSLRDHFVPFGQGGYWIRYVVSKSTITIIRLWHGREDRNQQN